MGTCKVKIGQRILCACCDTWYTVEIIDHQQQRCLLKPVDGGRSDWMDVDKIIPVSDILAKEDNK